MSLSLTFIRLLFLIICVAFSISAATHYFEGGFNLINGAVGLLGGIAIAGLLIGLDVFFKRFNLKTFNAAAIGLFFGYLMAEAILFVLNGILGASDGATTLIPVRFFVFLFCSYLGMVMTTRAADELHVSIPFVQFKQTSHKKKDILVDITILTDPRIIDLASSGLLDHQLIMPRFALKELYTLSETGDETTKAKARRSLEVVKKLESITTLDIRYVDTDFSEIKDPMSKLIRLARFLDTNIITSDINRIQQSSIEGVRIININVLSNALKPITQSGEFINIKIQRYGKEARQGVGYLDDGTMVVVNGGAEFIGETIKAQVLSVKHTSSGRMIFCNTCEEGCLMTEQEFTAAANEIENTHKSYLTL
ncbi:MAG: TRAM domain-containing protein [Parachlamydiaceae bacterium]|nr:TRAM domain-containing protein [Parachlamydiaceae bacterium]